MGRSGFAAKFHAFVGESPLRYVVRCRLNKAIQYLWRGQEKPGTIARLVGYDSAATFAKAFKRHVGVSPGAYRRRVHGRWGETRGVRGAATG